MAEALPNRDGLSMPSLKSGRRAEHLGGNGACDLCIGRSIESRLPAPGRGDSKWERTGLQEKEEGVLILSEAGLSSAGVTLGRRRSSLRTTNEIANDGTQARLAAGERAAGLRSQDR